MNSKSRILRRLRAWRPRVALVLTLLVCIPGSVLGLQIRDDLRGIDNERTTSQRVLEETELRLDAIAVEAALADERNWVIINSAVAEFGVDFDLIADVLGVDLRAQLEQSVATLDALTEDDSLGVREAVVELRTLEPSLDVTADSYSALEAEVREIGTNAAAAVIQLSSGTRSGPAIRLRMDFVEDAAGALRAVQGQHVSLFAAQFSVGSQGPMVAFQDLIESRRDYLRFTERLDWSAPAAAAPALGTVVNDPAVLAIKQASDDLIQQVLQDGLAVEGDGVTAAAASLDQTAALFNNSIAAIEVWLDFSLSTGSDLTALAVDLDQASVVAAHEKKMLALSIGGMTLLALLLVTRLIVAPIRRLADAAHAAQAGEPVKLRPSGPAEVHLAGQVVGELAGNIELATEQALALARGDLEDPNLVSSVSGPIGESLNRAVDTLAESIREREHFRVRLAYQADHDDLTGVPNRSATTRHLGQVLADARAAGTSVAVLYIDLDGFKPINDLHGHRNGDELLAATARRLDAVLRANDFVGRLGGDEFVLIAREIEGADDAVSLAQRVRAVLTESTELVDGTVVSVGASIGVAIAGIDDTPESVLHDADLALYAAKGTGRNTVELCTDNMRLEAAESIGLSAAIRSGLENDDFTLVFQPVVNADGAVESVESLIRWNRDGVMVAPGSFIPFAERSDLIIEIDAWVTRRAARQLAQWAHHPVLGDVAIAINISRRHLGDSGFVDCILGPLAEFGVDPSRLIVEVTETALLEHEDDAAEKLAALRAVGVRVAIDDFGTGYTGLGHLHTMPVDVIKIDQGFVTHLADVDSPDVVLIRLIIEAGHQLGAAIIAEGVERIEQAEILAGLGSDRMQGFYFARPTPADAIAQTIAELRANPLAITPTNVPVPVSAAQH